jgi:pimeloyl-ACP methyl ester carboxylesterase
MRLILILLLSCLAGTEAGAAASCADIAGAKCTIELATGIRMAYLETGPATGPAVILVHGLTDTSRSWSPAMRALHRLDPALHILAIDQRGHGASSLPAGAGCAERPESCFRTADLADDLVAFMDAKRITSATLAGHSLGSFVVQEMAYAHPDHVARAVLVATSTRVTSIAAPAGGLPEDPLVGPWRRALEARGKLYPAQCYRLTPLDADPQATASIARDWDADPVADPALVAAVAPETAHTRLGTWIGATRALLALDNTRRLATIGLPTLVLWGTQDSIFTATDQAAVREALAAAAERGVPAFWKPYGTRPLPASGAQTDEIGHNVQWDAPDQVAADIDAFIRLGHPTSDRPRFDPATRRVVAEAGPAGGYRLEAGMIGGSSP